MGVAFSKSVVGLHLGWFFSNFVSTLVCCTSLHTQQSIRTINLFFRVILLSLSLVPRCDSSPSIWGSYPGMRRTMIRRYTSWAWNIQVVSQSRMHQNKLPSPTGKWIWQVNNNEITIILLQRSYSCNCSGNSQDTCEDPDKDCYFLSLRCGAEILGLHGMNNSIVPDNNEWCCEQDSISKFIPFIKSLNVEIFTVVVISKS